MVNRILAAACIAMLAAGCTVVLKPKHVPRLVASGLKNKDRTPSYTMRVHQVELAEGAGRDVRFTITKGTGVEYAYDFDGGLSFWSVPGGCAIVDRRAGRADVFSGLAQPSGEAVRQSLIRYANRWLSTNRVTAQTGTRECGRTGYRVRSKPLKAVPLVSETETFFDKQSKAILLIREFDADGALVLRRRSESLKILAPGEYVRPSVPEDCRTVLHAAAGKGAAPSWAKAPARTLDILARPRASATRGTAAFDLSRAGHLFVLFQRRSRERALVSPAASTVTVNGAVVRFWRIGPNTLFRWNSGGVEHTVVTTVPQDMVHRFLAENIPAEARPELVEKRP